MSAIDVSTLDRLVEQFKALPIGERLIALGKIYADIENTLPGLATPHFPDGMETMMHHILELSESDQLQFLGALLGEGNANGAIQSLVQECQSFAASDRMALWYLIAGNMGKRFITLPANGSLSESATEIVTVMNSYDSHEKIKFMNQIV